eukprot:13570071-Alexandrium_andersonii.AAC.1
MSESPNPFAPAACATGTGPKLACFTPTSGDTWPLFSDWPSKRDTYGLPTHVAPLVNDRACPTLVAATYARLH